MTCAEARKRLTAGRGGGTVAGHVAQCPACARFSERMAAAEALLSERASNALPDSGFARRVVQRLPEPAELMGWAALRLLPATLALALVLTGWCLLSVPSPARLVEEAPSDDLLTWVVSAVEEES